MIIPRGRLGSQKRLVEKQKPETSSLVKVLVTLLSNHSPQ